MDQTFEQHSRTVTGMLSMFAEIGGLYNTLLGIGIVIVGFVNSKFFMSEIIRNIYNVRKYEDTSNSERRDLNSNGQGQGP